MELNLKMALALMDDLSVQFRRTAGCAVVRPCGVIGTHRRRCVSQTTRPQMGLAHYENTLYYRRYLSYSFSAILIAHLLGGFDCTPSGLCAEEGTLDLDRRVKWRRRRCITGRGEAVILFADVRVAPRDLGRTA